jgi:hypothetical protein
VTKPTNPASNSIGTPIRIHKYGIGKKTLCELSTTATPEIKHIRLAKRIGRHLFSTAVAPLHELIGRTALMLDTFPSRSQRII